ncbi:MAG: tryptophan 7-halogenase [Alphaproteobacteria bacterium]|nr:tryptophan 7-halogenase [Alphaproteobacteria bacterium]
MAQLARHIAIVGGGTAGWLAALILGDGARRAGGDIRLTMIESSKIPTIGVGEGSTAVFRQMLRQFGLDEFEFLRQTDATIKYGIRHKDWRRQGVTYDGPIDDPHLVCETPPGVASSWLNQYCIASGRSVAEPHLFTYLMDRGKAPYAQKLDGSFVPAGPFHHAFHFDQALVAKYLARNVPGVERIDAQVTGVSRNAETGDIETLLLDEDRSLDADFFVDCTGFRRALIGKEMGGQWVSYVDKLPVNRAMPFWIDLAPGEQINPFTLAWAREAGWMWSIPTRTRYGCGYVYSDRFRTPEQAQAEIEAALGRKIEPRNDIKINSGRLDTAWIGNCLAVGLSSSFLEPLEATSIHGTIVQLLLFAQAHLNADRADIARHRDAYNAIVARQVDDFMRFINMHYVSERRDTAFWQAVAGEFILPETRERLAFWSGHTPRRADFAPFPFRLPHVEEQLFYPVLDGLGLLDRDLARAELAAAPQLRAHARKTAESLTREYRQAALRTLGHREFLDGLVA